MMCAVELVKTVLVLPHQTPQRVCPELVCLNYEWLGPAFTKVDQCLRLPNVMCLLVQIANLKNRTDKCIYMVLSGIECRVSE